MRKAAYKQKTKVKYAREWKNEIKKKESSNTFDNNNNGDATMHVKSHRIKSHHMVNILIKYIDGTVFQL